MYIPKTICWISKLEWEWGKKIGDKEINPYLLGFLEVENIVDLVWTVLGRKRLTFGPHVLQFTNHFHMLNM